jgi:hypothetical protein
MSERPIFDTSSFVAQLERVSLEVLYAVHQAAVAEARALAGQVVSTYPLGATGNLRANVRWAVNRPQRQVGGVALQLGAHVRSTAKHAHIIEQGRPGPGRGRQHAARAVKGKSVIFIPLAVQARARFYARVQSILDAPRSLD